MKTKKIKKTTFGFPEEFHQKFKIFCAEQNIGMITLIMQLIDAEIAKRGEKK